VTAEGPEALPPDEAQRCALIAVLGAPNAGKSSLVNALVGVKVSIVTRKVQTTRFRIRGVVNEGAAQLILVDTPGVFQPKRRLDRAMVAAAWSALGDADHVILVHDSQRPQPSGDEQLILDRLAEQQRKVTLVLTKIDLVPKPSLMPLAARYGQEPAVERIFMVANPRRDGTDDLRRYLADQAPAGPWLFPDDEPSDLPARLLAAEITREKLFESLHEEIPYGLSVETERWEDFKDGSVKIEQLVLVSREGHRRIAIGAGGGKIRALRQQAQAELEEIFERPVHLFLTVKADPRWAEDGRRLREWGLEEE